MNFDKLSCDDFCAALASSEPVPGGGGAAALTGALGASLGAMVASITRNGKNCECSEEMDVLLERAEKLRTSLLALINKDAEGFEPLSRAYSLPKDAPDRAHIMETALKTACAAPLDIMRLSCETLSLLDVILEKGSKILVSDVGTGAACCKAALLGGAMTVFINTKLMKDKSVSAQIESDADEMLEKYGELADDIVSEVAKRIRG